MEEADRVVAPRSLARVAGWLRWAGTWLVAIVIFAIVLGQVPLREVESLLAAASLPEILLAAAVALVAEIVLNNVRFLAVLALLGHRLQLFEIVRLRAGTMPLRKVLPFKIGEVLRLAYLKRRHGVSWVKGVSSSIINSAFVAIGPFVVLLAGLSFRTPGFAVGLAACIGAFVLATCLVGRGARATARLAERVPWAPLRDALHEVGRIQAGGGVRRWLTSTGIASVAVAAADAAVFALVFHAVGVNVPLPEMMSGAAVVLLVTTLPITPMGLGTREATVLTLFSTSARPEALVSAGLLVSLLSEIVPVLVGLVFTPYVLSRLGRAREPSGGDKSAGGVA